MTANIRAHTSDQNKLIEALKFRYLHILKRTDQSDQLDLLTERADQELIRLLDLREHYDQDPGHMVDWLEREISEIENRLLWLSAFKLKID